jgi:hypothetical protein
LLVSAAEIAVTVAALEADTIAGAVYMPDADMVPTVALPPATSFTRQLTEVFDVPMTVAANVCVMPA